MTLVAELMVLPVPAKQPKTAFAAETGWMSHRLADFEVSRENAGVDVERVSLLETPIGHITISYLEGSNSYRDVAKTIRTTPTVFDTDMMTRGKVLHGMTEEQQKEKRAPLETEVLYRSVSGTRQPWHSFVAAVPPENLERWQEFCAALNGPRRAEFEAFNDRNGFSVFCEGIYHGQAGDVACIYLEGSQDFASLPKALAGGGDFETWFAEEFQAIHGADVREGLPWPSVAVPWDWVKGEPNNVVAPLYARVASLLGE